MSAPHDIEAALVEQIRALKAIMAKAIRADKLNHAIAARADLGRAQSELHRRREARLAEGEATREQMLQRKRQLAEGEGSWVAAAKYMALEEEERERERRNFQQAKDYTPEEWKMKVRDDAAATTDRDLELYVHEWLERSGLRLMVDQGEPRLMRAS